MKNPPADHRANLTNFLERGWDVIWQYMERLEDDGVVKESDSRACSSVVNSMLDKAILTAKAISEINGNEGDEKVPLPGIDENIINEVVERVIAKTVNQENNRKVVCAKKPRVSGKVPARVRRNRISY